MIPIDSHANGFNRVAQVAYHDDYHRYVAQNYRPEFINIVRSRGDFIFDEDGIAYLDALQGYGSGNFGHVPDEIVNAIISQLTTPDELKNFLDNNNDFMPGDRLPFPVTPGGLDFTTNNLATALRTEFCKQLSLFSKIPNGVVIPKSGGSEAFESAKNAIRRWGYYTKSIPENHAEIITFGHCFHGRMPGAVAASTDPSVKKGFGPFLPGFTSVPYGDIEAFKNILKQLSEKTAGIVIEPIQGEAGVILPPKGYLQELQNLCAQHNILFVLDEIQSGFGRTGKDWAWGHELDRSPDGILTAKALAGGEAPVSAFVAKPEIMKHFDYGSDGSTFSGNPIGCAAALAALKLMKDKSISQKSHEKGVQFGEYLEPLRSSPLVKDIRGRGLWWAVEFESEDMARRMALQMIKNKVFCRSAHESLRLSPALTIKPALLKRLAEITLQTVKEFESNPRLHWEEPAAR